MNRQKLFRIVEKDTKEQEWYDIFILTNVIVALTK